MLDPSPQQNMTQARLSTWIQKRQENPRSHCYHRLNNEKGKEIPNQERFFFIISKLLTMQITANYH